MYLHLRAKNNKKAKILWKLNNKDSYKEIYYWRKEYKIHEYFNELFGGLENCKEYLITKKQFKEFIESLIHLEEEFYEFGDEIKELNKLYKTIDWETQDVYYMAWW